MRCRTPIVSVALASVVCGCGASDAPPRPQWLVEVSTDAPVPALADRLLVEVLTENGQIACPSCRREAVLAEQDAWPASFGIEATDAGVLVRARLYRSDHVGSQGQPDPATTIDAVGRLPPVGEGITPIGIRLELACIGVAVSDDLQRCCVGGTADQAPPQLGGPLGSNGEVSDLFTRIDRDCPSPDSIEDGMACVPGGLFFLGDSLAPAPHSDVSAAAVPERLFAVDSFLLDQHEVTVAEFHQFILHQVKEGRLKRKDNCPVYADKPETKVMFCRKPSEQPTSQKWYCTYNVEDPITHKSPSVSPESDDRSVNCVSRSLAADYCAWKKKRLPTEVEWEYAAANGMRETRYPWGNRPPSCDLAWLSRGATSPVDKPFVQCALTGDAGTDGEGVTSLAGMPQQDGKPADRARPWADGPDDKAFIYGLGGNVSEWTADYFLSYGDRTGPKCWIPSAPIAYLSDRLASGAWCLPPSDRSVTYHEYSVRGGNWRESLDSAWSANRAHATDPLIVPRPDVGFRCAR
jgi:formylglycine-generating enzyme required for sulfatase activity